MGGTHPACTDRHRPVVDPAHAQPLESLERTHDVHHRVGRSDFVQRDLVGRDAVDPAFGLAQEPECADGTLPDRGRQRRAIDSGDQLADVVVAAVTVLVSVGRSVVEIGVVRVRLDGCAGKLSAVARQGHVDLGRAQSAAIHGFDLYGDLGKAQPAGESA